VTGIYSPHRWRAAATTAGLLPLLALGLVGAWVATRPAATSLLATVHLPLDPHAAVDVALDGRRHRLFLVNAGVVWTIDTRTGVIVRVVRDGTPYVQALDSPAPALDAWRGRLYVPNLVDDTLAVIDSGSGRVQRLLHLAHQPDEVAVDGRTSRVFVGSTADWTLTTLAARTERPRATRPFAAGDLPGQLVVDPAGGPGVAAGYGGQVTLFDARTGRPLHGSVPDHGHLITGLTVDASARRIFGLVENEPAVVVLDARTAALLRVIPVGQNPTALALDPTTGRAFVADGGDGSVYVLDVRSGRVMRRVSVGPAPVLAVDTRRGRVIVASTTGLSLLDAHGGHLLRWWPVALSPAAVLIDARAGRILLVETGRTEPIPAPWAWLRRGLRRWVPFLVPPHVARRVIPARLLVLREDRL